MNEDFVSFDLAKKLKNKGFPQYTEKSYFVGDHKKRMCSVGTFLHVHTQNTEHLIAAPTIAQVLKWLRENKELFVEVSVNNHTGLDFYFAIYEKGEECWIVCGFNEEWYDTYEGAAIAGIKCCLDNLI